MLDFLLTGEQVAVLTAELHMLPISFLMCLGVIGVSSSQHTNSENLDSSACTGSGIPSDDQCSKLSMSTTEQSSAVMLYQPLPFLEPFRKDRRTFTLSGQEILIQQKWDEIGVAAVVWDAAVVLSEYLEREVTAGKLVLSGKKIIELGAGTGLVSLAVALLGGQIISTDRQEALGILRENVAGNFKDSLSTLQKSVMVRKLSWGDDLEEFSDKFDLILGADIVYIEETFDKLLKTIRYLSSSSSRILLSCRIRYDRDLRFLDLLREFFSVSIASEDESRGISIYEAIMK